MRRSHYLTQPIAVCISKERLKKHIPRTTEAGVRNEEYARSLLPLLRRRLVILMRNIIDTEAWSSALPERRDRCGKTTSS